MTNKNSGSERNPGERIKTTGGGRAGKNFHDDDWRGGVLADAGVMDR